MTNFITTDDLQNVDKISKMSHESNEPIFVLKDNKVDMVIFSLENYENLMNRIYIHDMIIKGKEQIDSNEAIDFESVYNSLKEKYKK